MDPPSLADFTQVNEKMKTKSPVEGLQARFGGGALTPVLRSASGLAMGSVAFICY